MPRHSLTLGLVVVLSTVPRTSGAQHIRRTDAVVQDDLASTGFASDSLCIGSGSASPGGFDVLPELSGASPKPVHFAVAATGLAERLKPGRDPAQRRGGGLAQLRAHGATACRFDGTVRALVGAGGVSADALAVFHAPGALGGAVHAFLEAGMANDSTSSDRLDVPRGLEAGLAYTTLNLLELVPVFRSPSGQPRLDLRARLSAGALLEYAGDARRVHGKSIVPEYSATTALVVHEVVNLGLLYTARVVPGYLAPTARSSTGDRALWEQTVVLEHAFLTNGTSRLSTLEPFVGARYSWRRLGRADQRHELALHVGVHLD
jgi:hypothetical protein